MTPQEQQLLQDLTAKINQTVLPDKDPEAEQFLMQSLGRNPDALYILAQTVLVQNYALTQAQGQIEQLKQQAVAPPPPVPQKHTSFLGNLLGMNDEPAPAPPPATYQPVRNAPPPQYQQPYQQAPYGQMPYGQPQQSGGFLQSAMQTATGVAAGALAFEGIESLMHGFGHHAGYGAGLGDYGSQGREEVVNNYYGDSDRHEGHGDSFGDRLSSADRNERSSGDLEDRRDNDSSAFADSDGSVSDDDTSGDISSSDDNFDPGGNDSSF